jgi:hypothetical protein
MSHEMAISIMNVSKGSGDGLAEINFRRRNSEQGVPKTAFSRTVAV